MINGLIALFLSLTLQCFAEYQIISGSAHPKIGEAVKAELGKERESQLGDIYLIQSLCPSESQSINDTLMELFSMVRKAKRETCGKTTAVLPYFCKTNQNDILEDTAYFLESTGVDRILGIDLPTNYFHSLQASNINSTDLLAEYFANKSLVDPVLLHLPGSDVSYFQNFQERLNENGVKAILAKMETSCRLSDFVGELQGKDVLIISDFCDTTDGLISLAEFFEAEGSRKIYASIAHSTFQQSDFENLKLSPFQEVVITDTLPIKGVFSEKVTQVSLAPLLAEAIGG